MISIKQIINCVCVVISLQARSTDASDPIYGNELILKSELSWVASWQVDIANWNNADGSCSTFPNYSFTTGNPQDCCAEIVGCTTPILNTLGLGEFHVFYVGAELLPTSIDEFNAAVVIPTLLKNEPFVFLLGNEMDGISSPNPVGRPDISDKLGIGLSADGSRLVLIMGKFASSVGYTNCAAAPPVPITTPPPVSTTIGNGSTIIFPTTISTISTIYTIDNAAYNLGVGYVVLGVVGVAYLNL